jgi:hypothetical protein
MNEIHLTGQVKSTWTYDGHLYVRMGVPRSPTRPGKPAAQGGQVHYVSVVFVGGARQGMTLAAGQQLAVHGFLQSRDIRQPLADFLRRAREQDPGQPEAAVPAGIAGRVVMQRAITEVVAERWEISSARTASPKRRTRGRGQRAETNRARAIDAAGEDAAKI